MQRSKDRFLYLGLTGMVIHLVARILTNYCDEFLLSKSRPQHTPCLSMAYNTFVLEEPTWFLGWGEVLSVFENLAQDTPKPRFTVGIQDDVTHLSLPVGPWLNVLPEGTTECMFYGLGSDGTVGANKSAVKMIALGSGVPVISFGEPPKVVIYRFNGNRPVKIVVFEGEIQ